MSSQRATESTVEISVQNIGGIDDTYIELASNVSVLTGRNATNRTSFLRAVMAALGSEDVSLKGDADEGSVELLVNGERYSRSLSRRDGKTVFGGEPYLEDAELADLFAFLLETNDARRAVERGDDLYDVIMRPIDTDEIDEEIERLEAERHDLAQTLQEFEDLERQLPNLESERTDLEAAIETTQRELDAKQTELDAMAQDTQDTSEIESRFDELREARNELENVRRDIEDEERILEALREDHAELEADLDGLAEVDDGERDELETAIDQRRETIQAIESTVGELQSVLQFNDSLLEGAQPEILHVLHDDGEEGAEGTVTDQLIKEDEDVVCWTCGSRVERAQIEQTIDLLREVHTEKIEDRNRLRDEIDELEAERKHIERTRQERRRLGEKLAEAESDIEQRSERLEQLEADAGELEARVAELNAAVEALETDGQDERLALHREVNELEFELDQLGSQLDDVTNEIDDIEARLTERDDIEARRDAIDEEIEQLRSRIERLEKQSVEQFNDQMDTILDLLGFENLERIWIERRGTTAKEGRRTVNKTTFDLHVVRSSESGAVYEDSIDHLSESERELVGLMFALAGYLVHQVYEQVPFMLLDSLEAFDAERISALVDYLTQYPDHLVVALLPEDATAVDGYYERVTEL